MLAQSRAENLSFFSAPPPHRAPWGQFSPVESGPSSAMGSVLICRVRPQPDSTVTELTPGAGNRSTPNRHGIRCRKSAIARAPSPSPSPEPTVRTIRVHPRPFAVLPFPSTNGANHPSLGYSPRNSHIETVQGLKARPIRSRHPPGHETGPSALRSSRAQFLWRCHRLGWCRAVGPQTKRDIGPRTNQAINPRTNRAVGHS